MRPARIVFFGYHTIGARCLERLVALGQEVVLVVTHADSAEEPAWFESVTEVSRRHRIPVCASASPNSPEMVEALRRLAPDLLVSVYYRRILAPELLALARIAAVNVHGSLLPKYRGRAPLNWALVQGERETGVTLHHMIPEPDAGDIIVRTPIPVGPDDTALTVYHRMIAAAEALLGEALPRVLAGTAPRMPQDPRRATVFGRRRPEDGRFNWGWPSGRIHNLVRAVTHPYPGAFTVWRGRRLFVWRTRLVDGMDSGGWPGQIVEMRQEGFVIRTGEGRLLVASAQVEGGEELPGRAFAEQAGLGEGDLLSP